MDNEDQLRKIRGLLAKAEATEFPGEAETYTARAMALISKWGIDQSLLDATTQSSTEVVDRKITLVAPFARDKMRLLYAVVKALGGDAVKLSKYSSLPGEEVLHVFATQTDMDRIDMVFTSLLVQCSAAMNYAVAVSREAALRPRKFKSDFLYGFADQVGYRLRVAEQTAAKDAEGAAAQQGTSTALVLVSKEKQIRSKLESTYSELTTTRTSNRAVGGGYGHGKDAGKRADIGGKKGASQGALVG